MEHHKSELNNPDSTLLMQRIEFAELSDAENGDMLNPSKSPLLSIKTKVEVCVGRLSLSVEDFLAAREHQVFVLDQTVDREVDLMVEGKVVARGMLVAVGDSFAVKLTSLPMQM